MFFLVIYDLCFVFELLVLYNFLPFHFEVDQVIVVNG